MDWKFIALSLFIAGLQVMTKEVRDRVCARLKEELEIARDTANPMDDIALSTLILLMACSAD